MVKKLQNQSLTQEEVRKKDAAKRIASALPQLYNIVLRDALDTWDRYLDDLEGESTEFLVVCTATFLLPRRAG